MPCPASANNMMATSARFKVSCKFRFGKTFRNMSKDWHAHSQHHKDV